MQFSNMEIQRVIETNHAVKVFGHCIIHWKIENFCVATFRADWTLFSSEFYVRGPEQTKWQMVLNPQPTRNDTHSIKLQLERLESEGPDIVWANWKISLLNSKENEIFKTQCEYYFDKKSKCSVNLKNLSFLLSKFRPLDPDIFIIRCQLIVNVEKSNKNFEKPNSVTVRSLSRDLKKLCKNGNFYDVLLRMDNKDIRAHKSILQSRNSVLASIIKNDPSIEIILLQLDYEAVKKIISYLYSGSLDIVLSEPTIFLHECILRLDINELKEFYTPDELIVHTEVNIQEYAFLWLITEFTSRTDDCIVSPVLNKEMPDISWRFQLFPNGVEDNVEYIGICVESVDVKKPMEVCMEFAIMNSNLEAFCLKRFRRSFEGPKRIGFNKFAKRDRLESSFLINNTLRIVCKIRMSSGTYTSRNSAHMSSFITSSTMTSYECLSSNMNDMLKSNNFKDVTVFVDRTQIKAHKCILGARSRVLTNMINQVSDNKPVVLTISDIEATTMRTVFSYIYTGVLENIDLGEIPKVYAAAEKFDITSLQKTCVEYLQNNIRLETVCDILVFANDKREKELKSAVLTFISQDPDAVFSQEKWVQLVETRNSVCDQITRYLQNKPRSSKTSASSNVVNEA